MKLTTEQLINLLSEIKDRVAAGDSFEGSIQYTCMVDDLDDGGWDVVGAIRIGNTNGQGGMAVFPSNQPKT